MNKMLRTLHRKILRHHNNLDAFILQMKELLTKEIGTEVSVAYLPGDGYGVTVNDDTYASLAEIIEMIESGKPVTKQDVLKVTYY